MQGWELEKVEKMNEDQKRKYLERLVNDYQNEIEKLKTAKSKHDLDLALQCGWRAVVLAGAISVFAGPAMAVFGEGMVKTIGEILSVASIGVVGGGLVAMIGINDDGPREIQEHLEASKDAKRQIADLKKKVKEINTHPVMEKR